MPTVAWLNYLIWFNKWLLFLKKKYEGKSSTFGCFSSLGFSIQFFGVINLMLLSFWLFHCLTKCTQIHTHIHRTCTLSYSGFTCSKNELNQDSTVMMTLACIYFLHLYSFHSNVWKQSFFFVVVFNKNATIVVFLFLITHARFYCVDAFVFTWIYFGLSSNVSAPQYTFHWKRW